MNDLEHFSLLEYQKSDWDKKQDISNMQINEFQSHLFPLRFAMPKNFISISYKSFSNKNKKFWPWWFLSSVFSFLTYHEKESWNHHLQFLIREHFRMLNSFQHLSFKKNHWVSLKASWQEVHIFCLTSCKETKCNILCGNLTNFCSVLQMGDYHDPDKEKKYGKKESMRY